MSNVTPTSEGFVRVEILRNTVQTGVHLGRKGDEIDVPVALADAWVSARHARRVVSKAKGGK